MIYLGIQSRAVRGEPILFELDNILPSLLKSPPDSPIICMYPLSRLLI